MPSRPVLVGLGEILWDIFPDGPRFGGAPANFVCSAAGLAGSTCEVCMVSAVGQDRLGQDALAALEQHRVDTTHVATLPLPTGQVLVNLDAQGHPSYEFASDTAWDAIPWNDSLRPLARRADVICFGTLGQRSSLSRTTIQRFITQAKPSCLRLLDINLRPPFWTESVVRESLEQANALKLNDDELPVLAGLFSLHGTDREQMRQLIELGDLHFVALTRGSRGAAILHSSGEWSEQPAALTDVVDTVGAGDAFTAAITLGLLMQQPLDKLLSWAIRVAAYVCGQPGATPELPTSLRMSAHS